MVSLMAIFSGWRFVKRRGWCQNPHPLALTIAYRSRSGGLRPLTTPRKIHKHLFLLTILNAHHQDLPCDLI
jgi:hypothetical protein